MSLKSIPLFSALTERMKWLTERQKVLSENVANADSPNYKAKDLEPQKFRDLIPNDEIRKVEIASTNKAHILPKDRSKFDNKVDRDSYETTPTGNSVVLESEMLKIAETQLEYKMTTSLYKKHMEMYKTALGRR
jgi:flagellar basal-body rod protein FlgB